MPDERSIVPASSRALAGASASLATRGLELLETGFRRLEFPQELEDGIDSDFYFSPRFDWTLPDLFNVPEAQSAKTAGMQSIPSDFFCGFWAILSQNQWSDSPYHLNSQHIEQFGDSLVELRICGAEMGDAEIGFLENTPELISLALSSCGLSSKSIPAFGALRKVRSLDLGSNRIGTDGWRMLKMFTKLSRLDAGGNAITDEGIKYLCELPNLEELNVSSSGSVTDISIEYLNQLQSLDNLDLSNTNVSDLGIAHMNLPTLRSLSLTRTRVTGLRFLQASLPQLEYLRLNQTLVDDDTLIGLSNLKNLRSLWVDKTKVTKRGVDRLRERLPHQLITNFDFQESECEWTQ